MILDGWTGYFPDLVCTFTNTVHKPFPFLFEFNLCWLSLIFKTQSVACYTGEKAHYLYRWPSQTGCPGPVNDAHQNHMAEQYQPRLQHRINDTVTNFIRWRDYVELGLREPDISLVKYPDSIDLTEPDISEDLDSTNLKEGDASEVKETGFTALNSSIMQSPKY